jgi:hypothetical protein
MSESQASKAVSNMTCLLDVAVSPLVRGSAQGKH